MDVSDSLRRMVWLFYVSLAVRDFREHDDINTLLWLNFMRLSRESLRYRWSIMFAADILLVNGISKFLNSMERIGRF